MLVHFRDSKDDCGLVVDLVLIFVYV